MAKKLDKNQIAAVSSLIVVGAKGATEVWEAVNKDDRVSKGLRSLGTRVATARSARGPQARLEKQLDLIEQHAFAAAERPEQVDAATEWLRQARTIREKLPLVVELNGRAGRRAVADLRGKVTALMTEIITHDFEDGDVEDGPTP